MALLPIAATHAQFGTSAPMPDIDAGDWRLEVTGPAIGAPFSLTLDELSHLEIVGKREQLICPGLYAYMADWEGVPLSALLAMGKTAPDWHEITFTAADGFVMGFTREEVETHLLFIAIRKNGGPVPRSQGFPARLVAAGFSGGRWVRWITALEVE
jgi:DMSO/TMAO reductase YedYZ molybdopterin-dependent catalytic subunit